MTRAWIPEGWDEGVIALGGHFLQSTAWARVQERIGNRVVVGADRDWCWLGIVRRAGPFRYLYLPFGPSLRAPAALEDALASARRRAQRLGCVLLRFEPARAGVLGIAATGAARVRPRQYEHTLVLRLDGDEESLRRGLNSGHRSRIRTAEKRGLRIERSSDPGRMPEFVRLLRETERRGKFFSYEDAYFATIAEELLAGGEASLYFARAGEVDAAAALVFDFGPTRYYAFAATRTDSRKLMPAAPLVWQAIVDARRDGRTRFDFWGAAPPEAGPEHPWAGITDFKRGFGGEREDYAGTWELPVRPLAARLFALAHAVRH
ncbi:MAG TPA: peptidoglycan bridge formation glycyltransferase FemA/FemB family protein [Candidatus Dormibacteraeota bacterium]|nr:peptidoglycan bridge formation glycyltransferase FemA/FemB family protein [Candidatus Dormibacteraeota bacterium]